MIVTEVLLWMFRRRHPYRVSGRSMEPLFHEGELLLINPSAYASREPAVDDVVVCGHPHKSIDVVKYVADVDEETVALRSPGGTDSRQFGRAAISSIRGQVTVSVTRLRRVH